MPIQPSPSARSAWASAISEPPPLLPSSTTASAPRWRRKRGRRGHVDDALLVEAVGVVVLVAGAEAEHAVAGVGEQRAGVVDREVAPGVGEDDPGAPAGAAGRRPQRAPHEGAVLGDEPDRLPGDVDAGIVLRQRPEAEAGGAGFTERGGHGSELSTRVSAKNVPRPDACLHQRFTTLPAEDAHDGRPPTDQSDRVPLPPRPKGAAPGSARRWRRTAVARTTTHRQHGPGLTARAVVRLRHAAVAACRDRRSRRERRDRPGIALDRVFGRRARRTAGTG